MGEMAVGDGGSEVRSASPPAKKSKRKVRTSTLLPRAPRTSPGCSRPLAARAPQQGLQRALRHWLEDDRVEIAISIAVVVYLILLLTDRALLQLLLQRSADGGAPLLTAEARERWERCALRAPPPLPPHPHALPLPPHLPHAPRRALAGAARSGWWICAS